MKIIQVIPMFGLAGAETVCQNLTCSLAKRGHEVIVISLYNFKSVLTEKIENAGVRIIYLDKQKGLDLKMLGKLYKVFKAEKPDVVHTHMNCIKYAMPVAKLAGVPIKIHTVHNIAEKEASSVITKIIYGFLFKHLKVAPVALTDRIRDSIASYYRISASTIPVVLNGIDLSRCIPKLSYLKNEVFTFVHIGRFEEQKNHKGLIKSFGIVAQKYPDVRLQLIGDGFLRAEIEKVVDAMNLSGIVKLEGIKEDVYPFLNKADCFVLPSNFEGMPMTLIEAMGTGLPIVATNVGGIPDMITNNVEGILVNNSIDDVAIAMENIYRDGGLRVRLAQNALKRSQIMSADEMAKSYLKVYESVQNRNK